VRGQSTAENYMQNTEFSNKSFITQKPSETKKLARKFAGKALRLGVKNKAIVFSLTGGLGSGKTIFVQGFAKELGIKEKVLSPTFVIFKKYELPRASRVVSSGSASGEFFSFSCIHGQSPCYSRNENRIKPSTNDFRNFYHFDCYRIKKASDVLALGFKEIISDPKNIVAIEWGERIKRILPKDSASIFFVFLDKNKRKISFK